MRIKAVISLLGVVVFVGSLPSYAQSSQNRQQQIESHSKQAAEFLKENRLDLAASEFKSILALDPKNVDARGNLGVLLFFQGNYRDAIPQLRAALEQQHTLWKIQALLGMAEKRSGETDAARRDLEKSFPKVPEENVRIETGMELIDLYSANRELDKAATVVSVLRELKPTDEGILYSAYRIYSDLADESLISLTIVAPNSARMQQAMAHELAKRGSTKEAIEHYHEALKINPQLPGLHFELGEMLRTSGTQHREEAEAEYKAALQVNPRDEQAESRLGEIAVQRNDLKEAEQRLTHAVELQPSDPEANVGLAKVYMAREQPEKAKPLLERAIQLEPTSAVAHFRLGTVYRELGRTSDAKHEFDEYQKYKSMKEKLQGIYHDIAESAEEQPSRPRQ
ncbi:MAG TPA: tetratricopeptide repeat protein [Terriglobales bacterium]|nr:tetratricopeptide repeat protein [Terriglobales bacterium]